MTSTPPRNLNRRALFGGAAALGLAAVGGTSWALDRFVIEHAEVTGASGYAGLTGTQSSAKALLKAVASLRVMSATNQAFAPDPDPLLCAVMLMVRSAEV